MLVGVGRTLLAPKAVNTYENRYANKVGELSAKSFAEGEFQDSLDLALADQVQLSELLKRTYNNARSAFMRAFLPILTSSHAASPAESNPNNYDYVALGSEDAVLFGPEHICIRPKEFDAKAKADVDAHSANTNAVIARHPEIDFYAFYIEKDIDIDFTTGEKQPAAEYIFNSLNLRTNHAAKFLMNNAPSFDYYFFMTDHHWNLRGSYLAYTQLHALMRMQGLMLEPEEEVNLGEFGGSRATGAYSQFREDFIAYKFTFPKYELVTQNGEKFDNYGNQELYLSGALQGDLSYANFYGYDAGEVVISKTSDCSGSNNILIIGDSYDNAILKLIAAHYDNLYSIDLRYYKAYFDKDFDFDSYVAERGIKTVLLIGNREMFSSEDFLIDKEVR